MADMTRVRSEYVAGAQYAAELILKLNNVLDNLAALHNGAALAGTFVDAELAADVTAKHLAATDVTQATTDLGTIRTAITNQIAQRLSKVVGKRV